MPIPAPTKAHLTYSASSAERWVNCPASISLSEGLESPIVSMEAREGTMAAELLEKALKARLEAKIVPGSEKWKMKPEKVPAMYPREMAKDISDVIDMLSPILKDCEVWDTEKFLPIESWDMDGKVGGTADVVGLMRGTRDIIVIDLKYGQGQQVSAVNNLQLAIYGLGAASVMLGRKKLDFKVHGYIIQPRMWPKVQEWVFTPESLNSIVVAVRQAIEVGESSTPMPGHWCRWCRALQVCPAYAKTTEVMTRVNKVFPSASIESVEARVDALTTAELAYIQDHSEMIAKFLKHVNARLVTILESGASIPGYKLTETKGKRSWDMQLREQMLNDHPELFEVVQEVKGITEVTKMAGGKAAFEKIYGQYIRPGNTTLKLVKEASKKNEAIIDINKEFEESEELEELEF